SLPATALGRPGRPARLRRQALFATSLHAALGRLAAVVAAERGAGAAAGLLPAAALGRERDPQRAAPAPAAGGRGGGGRLPAAAAQGVPARQPAGAAGARPGAETLGGVRTAARAGRRRPADAARRLGLGGAVCAPAA